MSEHPPPQIRKSSVDEIRRRFDADVDRFSNLVTGQSATIDAPLALELVARSAAACTPQAARLLDVGCGAGNYSLKLLEHLPDLEVTLVDLSRPMLQRAQERLAAKTSGRINAFQEDIRQLALPDEHYDLVVAAAVLHHLRADDEWRAVFGKLYACLRPGGSVWISDLVEHSMPQVQLLMWQRYGEYLHELRSAEYRDSVLAYVEQEDTPRSLTFQLELLQAVGFQTVEILHKNGVFATFGAIK